MRINANVGVDMWRELIKLFLEIANEIRANRQRRKVRRLYCENEKLKEKIEYRDFVRRENERRRMRGKR